ncbi:DUF6607 family protein [Parasphingorhabdus sp.]|uniref:DUF6607 family protein n=1 Tax=Parasphingorhabdus sp. TaxID=2709688 RepID=UPI003264E6BD
MNKKLKTQFGAALFALAMATTPALANGDQRQMAATEVQASFEQDRADILAMAGDYKVKFDMAETTTWRDDYEPIKAKISGGHESVRVIKDTGTEIVLQHLLVAEHEGNTFVIKHWRQDWVYQPSNVLVYEDAGKWVNKDVPESERSGSWSQTVWQVDDSPRYGGLGKWKTVNGVRSWTSDWTARPLARRDAVRNPVYDHYQAINRHQPMPGGWIHWQDNTKMKMVDGKAVPYVQESVLNTYKKFDGYTVSAADDYWTKTQAYWEKVRAEWDAAIAATGGVTVEEEAHTGTVISARLLGMGTEISEGKLSEADAVKEAQSLIREATVKRPVKTAAKKTATSAEY